MSVSDEFLKRKQIQKAVNGEADFLCCAVCGSADHWSIVVRHNSQSPYIVAIECANKDCTSDGEILINSGYLD